MAKKNWKQPKCSIIENCLNRVRAHDKILYTVKCQVIEEYLIIQENIHNKNNILWAVQSQFYKVHTWIEPTAKSWKVPHQNVKRNLVWWNYDWDYEWSFFSIFSNFSTLLTCCFQNQRNKVMLFEKLKAFIGLMICASRICYTSIKRFSKINEQGSLTMRIRKKRKVSWDHLSFDWVSLLNKEIFCTNSISYLPMENVLLIFFP